MTKLLFQLPKPDFEVTPESKINASYAMLGVVAITAIISLVFVFQHMMVTPGFGQFGGYVVYPKIAAANDACDFPGGLIVPDNAMANYLKEKQKYRCAHTSQNLWCCYP